MAFAALRDVAAFLRRKEAPPTRSAAEGRPTVDRAILHGISQSGRFVRDYLYLGFNEDERGRQVFDAMLPHIPGTRRTFTNARFAQPGRNPTPHGDRLYPADQFPFTYAVTEDHLTGRRDGLLLRCRAERHLPAHHADRQRVRVLGRPRVARSSPTRGATTSTCRPRCAPTLSAGHPHFAPAGAVAERSRSLRPAGQPAARRRADARPAGGAGGLDARAASSRRPAASRRAAHGTLLPAHGLYPAIPGAALPRRLRRRRELVDDTAMPPVVRGDYAGAAAAGGHGRQRRRRAARCPVLEAPKATYTGWNPRAEGFAPGALCYNTGAVAALRRHACRACGGGRPARLAGGALSLARRLRGGGEGGGRARGGRASAAGRGRAGHHRRGGRRRAGAAAPLNGGAARTTWVATRGM